MKFNVAHIRERSTSGGWIDFAVFEARSNSGSSQDNATLLHQLTRVGRSSGLKIDKSALAFMQNGRPTFYGTKDLVDYLSKMGVPQWTHTIDA